MFHTTSPTHAGFSAAPGPFDWRRTPGTIRAPVGPGTSAGDLETWILVQVAYALGLDPLDLDAEADLEDYGFHGWAAQTLAAALAGHLERDLPAHLFAQMRTVRNVALYIVGAEHGAEEVTGLRFGHDAIGCPPRGGVGRELVARSGPLHPDRRCGLAGSSKG